MGLEGITADVDLFAVHFALASLWTGDLATAQQAAEAYRKAEPDDPFGYTNLATVYAFQQREADAKQA